MRRRRWPIVILVLFFAGGLWLFNNRATIFSGVFTNAAPTIKAPTNDVHSTEITKQSLSSLNFSGTQVISVNDNQPDFSVDDLSLSEGAWQKLHSRDWEGRAQVANAMLNKSLMPSVQREPLTFNPSGYHVYKNSDGEYLYNISHLIGYQLTGLNNEPKNLVTGTKSFNALHTTDNQQSMENYENIVAEYLKKDSHRYVRYRVTPIYRNVEQVPRGVEMEAQSITDDSIKFNVYVFNVEPGWQINYLTGLAARQ
ncbi:DNA/RNA non-specific endonuclease [Weissella confusa]|uniref:DNA/RNA non-specific endonuclease n=1 Tax=Weissella confusa TaxID=1583 RepID=A0A923SNI9_WEICO|nr:DNA/RNA non-specific endonuclease [Weissella confusa]